MPTRYLFADDVKLICTSNGINALTENLRKTWLWTTTWIISLNVNKCLHLYTGSIAPQIMIVPNSDIISQDPPQVRKTSNLTVIVDSSYKSSAREGKTVSKARCMLAILNRTFTRSTLEVFIPTCSAFFCLQLEYCDQRFQMIT